MAQDSIAPIDQFDEKIAAEHALARVPIVSPDARVEEVRSAMAGRRYDSATHIAVCRDGRLTGVLTIEELLSAPADARVEDHMDPDPPVVAPGTDQEIAATSAVHHGESALAVVDEMGRFQGFIPPHRLLAVLLQEHAEDMARLGGFLAGTSTARTASVEPVRQRLWHRLPWLLVGLAGALLAADIVAAFEGQLRDRVMLAFFIPGIVYLADAVGTQTEALVIRGMSVGVEVRQVVQRELATGLLVGLALALAFLPIAWWRWGEGEVVVIVALSLLAACSTATIVALALPWAFQLAGKDPAFGSGPLGTVIQDLLSILIYFAIARGFMG